jgi:8-oxo-dGTP diphosphatase
VGHVILAAGGVVWRQTGRGRIKVVVVHRPRYDDWSLPKGKLKRGETSLEAALREVREETGLRCEVGPELPVALYEDRKARPKLVRYWAMRSIGGRFRPSDEVDRVRWVRLERVAATLSHPHDRVVVAGLSELLVGVG